MFQTVNHAIVLWDPKIKPKGIYGGHLNIRSVVSKTEQLEQLLTNSILKDIAKKFQLTQMVNRPTRLTKSSQTLLDLIFTNKPVRLTKTYNLITGMSDHNLTLVGRKLSKMRHRNQDKIEGGKYISPIPKKDLEPFENEFMQTDWNDKSSGKNCEQACEQLNKLYQNIRKKCPVSPMQNGAYLGLMTHYGIC